MNTQKLSLQELEAFDSQAVRSGDNWRFLCPFCGNGKPKDDAHRSLSYNPSNGLWNCKRCLEKGKDVGHWVARKAAKPRFDPFAVSVPFSAQERKAVQAPSRPQDPFAVSLPTQAPKEAGRADSGDSKPFVITDIEKLKDTGPLWETIGADYLKSRGLDADICILADVQFCPSLFGGRGGIVFPIKDASGEIVAANTRSLQGEFRPSFGKKSKGVFATSEALNSPTFAITEAPIDALSLSLCGLSSFALCGNSTPPEWLLTHAKGKTVFVATDADESGNKAADSISQILRGAGANVTRLRPMEGFKDWNDVLRAKGREAFEELLLSLKVVSHEIYGFRPAQGGNDG